MSLVPINAISAASGTGNRSATESSIGKDRLNATLDIVVGTGMRSTAAIATIQIRICHSGTPVLWIMFGFWTKDHAMKPMIGSDTASS